MVPRNGFNRSKADDAAPLARRLSTSYWATASGTTCDFERAVAADSRGIFASVSGSGRRLNGIRVSYITVGHARSFVNESSRLRSASVRTGDDDGGF